MIKWDEKEPFHKSDQKWVYYKFQLVSEALEFASYKYLKGTWEYSEGVGINFDSTHDGGILIGLLENYE